MTENNVHVNFAFYDIPSPSLPFLFEPPTPVLSHPGGCVLFVFQSIGVAVFHIWPRPCISWERKACPIFSSSLFVLDCYPFSTSCSWKFSQFDLIFAQYLILGEEATSVRSVLFNSIFIERCAFGVPTFVRVKVFLFMNKYKNSNRRTRFKNFPL